MRRTTRTRVRRAATVATAAIIAGGLLGGPAKATAPEPPPPQSTSVFCAAAPSSSGFTDVPAGNTHADNIRCLAASGITKGKTSTAYDPSGPVTRDQMASFIARMIDVANSLEQTPPLTDLPAYDGTPDFDDVSPTSPHYTNIMRISQAGITQGKGPRRFDPTGRVTREEMAAFINRTAGFLLGSKYTTTDDYFTDDEASFAEADINGIASKGIAVGDGVDTYGPKAQVPRDQMASFLIRSLAQLHADNRIDALPRATNEAPDGNINGTGANAQAANTNEGVDVQSTAKSSNTFEACEITVVAASPTEDTVDATKCFRYVYKTGDVFVVDGANSNFDTFVAQLSPHDDITGKYSKSGQSTFSLKNEAPLGPEGVTGTAQSTTATLTIDDSATPTVDTYSVYRADGSALPGLTCQEQALTFAKVGTTSDPSPNADSGNATFTDTNLQPSKSYCYKVFSVDDGDESAASSSTGPVTTTAAAGAPRSTSASVGSNATPTALDTGDVITLVFDRVMSAPGSGDRIEIKNNQSNVVCGGNATCVLEAAGAGGEMRVIKMTLTGPPFPASVTLPADITNQSGFTDANGAAWNVADSPDKTLEIPASST